MEPVDHPPGHEIERINKEIEEQYDKDEIEPQDPPDWVSPLQETMDSDTEVNPMTWYPDLTGAEMMERDPSLTASIGLASD